MPPVASVCPGAALLRGSGAALLILTLTPAMAVAGGANGNTASGQDPLLLTPTQSAAVLAAAPVEHELPFYDLDWSLGLRGSYINDSASGARYEGLVLPSVTLSHTGKKLSFQGTADGELSKTDGNGVNIDAARLSAGSALQFNPDSALISNVSLARTQEDPNAPDVPDNEAATPVETSAKADSTFTRKFGRFNVSLGGKAERDVYGPTVLTDGTQVDNSSQNNVGFGGGLRLGFQLSPIVEMFTTANATRTEFDGPSPSFGTKLDGTTYTVMAGAAAKWDETLSASASVGVGLEHFDDPGLADVRATLYDAHLTFKPVDTLSLDGDFATTIGTPGPNGSGTASIQYAATGTATYLVNDWLDWRASAGWNSTIYAQSSQTDKNYDLGVGADYKLSRHAKLSADYSFGHSETTPNPPDDTHTVTLGVTFQK